MNGPSCVVCGGDGTLQNSFGSFAKCPACSGSGRRSETGGMRDVTKTKPSHHRPREAPAANRGAPKGAPTVAVPTTPEGAALAAEVSASSALAAPIKARLIQEIVEYEGSHGKCTRTFATKIRKQLRG